MLGVLMACRSCLKHAPSVGQVTEPCQAPFPIQQGFVKDVHYQSLLVADTPRELMQKMREFRAPASILGMSSASENALGVDVSAHSS